MSMLNTGYLRANLPTGIYCACEFDKQTPIYDPGDTVSGKVYFKAISRAPISGLLARLIGCESINFGNDFRSSTKAYLVQESFAPLTVPDDSADDNYWYPFTFNLPSKLLPTFSGPFGSIRYYVEAVVSGRKVVAGQSLDDMDLFLSEEYGAGFVVKPKLDLTVFPELFGPLFLVNDNSGGIRALFSRNKSPIRFTLSLHKKGFTIMEFIHFTVDINNGSSKPITATSLKLVQEMKFSLSTMKRSSSETVVKVNGGPILAHTTTCWENVLQVPADIPISIQGQHLSVNYKLRVTLVTSGFMENVKGEVGVMLGTIGIDDFDFFHASTAQVRSNSFTSSRDSLSPRLRQRPSHHNAPFRSTNLDHRRSISSLPSYLSVEREDARALEDPPPSYVEATQLDQ